MRHRTGSRARDPRPAARRSRRLAAAVGITGAALIAPAGALGAAQPLDVPYTQTFDALAVSGTANPWTDDATIPGWYSSRTTYNAGTGSSNTGALYSFGTGSDRALGSVASGSTTTVLYGVRLVNTTGGTVTRLDVSFTGEQWRNGNPSPAAAHGLTVGYQVDATSLTAGTWTDVPDLTFTGPVQGGTAGPLDGNLAANRVAVTGSITGLSLAPGQEIWLRFADPDNASSDHGLAIDDLTVSVPAVQPAGITVREADGDTAVSEGGAGDTYTLALSRTPASPVTVTVAGDADVAAAPAQVVLSDTTPATVTVSAVQDTDIEGPHTGTVTHTASSADPAFDGLAVPSVAVAVTDDENVCDAPSTPIGAVQGSGASAAITGPVTVTGTVVGDFEGASSSDLRGVYIQDEGDGNPLTSDAIFVFRGSATGLDPGDRVRVTGTAGEFQGQTQLSGALTIADCGTGTVEAADVSLPVPAAIGGVDFLERHEGMLVRFGQTLTVTESFQLGRFGQVVLSQGGRQRTPTDVADPGAPAQAVQAANLRARIILDDDRQVQNPDPILFGRGGLPLTASNTLRIGDTTSGVRGVLTYTWAGNAASGNAFRIRPVGSLDGTVPVFAATNPRPAAPPSAGSGPVRVATANVLNYFDTFTGCTFGVGGAPADCRGAGSPAEFERQNAKLVPEILGLDADVVALSEIENDGYGADSAIAELTRRLNAEAGPGAYAYVDADAENGVNSLGTDAIRVGFLYRPARVTPIGTTAVLNTGAFGLFQLTSGPPIGRSRPALAQTFRSTVTGGRVTVVANHLKSKSSACADNVAPVPSDPDTGDGQGNCNLTRTQAARELVAWLATGPTGVTDPDVLITGDLNSYRREDPIRVIREAGYRDLLDERAGAGAYSYVFDGQSGYLDHALATPQLESQVTGVAEWHVNADEPTVLDYNLDFKSANQQQILFAPDPYRSSDHDPLIVGLDLTPSVDVADATAAEGDELRFVVRLSAPAVRPTQVRWRSVGVTATVPGDVLPAQGVALVRRGETEAVITVRTRADDVADPGETVRVTVEAPDGHQAGDIEAIGTITE